MLQISSALFCLILLIDSVLALFFLGTMVETLGEAWNLSWGIHIRCLDDGREGLKHRTPCVYKKQLDLETLVATRGRDFPISQIGERLRCPRCGCRRVGVMFKPPSNAGAKTSAVRWNYSR